MRVAFFSPLPPAKSGIADYSAALLEPLNRLARVEVFDHRPDAFDASRFDVCLYQLGNNPHHAFVYEMALENPGVVVMHEANLHHLIAHLTIERGDWDAYIRAVEENHGSDARQYAEQYVRTKKRAPDYSLGMGRTLLSRSRGAVVHSDAVARELSAQGFEGPIAKIPHGAWIERPDRMLYRARLGMDAMTPLIGIFGFLKPYKRIEQSLRALRRLIQMRPEVKMILVGEAHPDLPLASIIHSMQLERNVRHIDFAPIDDFNGYLGACDVVLNLRYPTVGESSGTLMRALGMGKAVIVSDVGSFAEFPDDVCLKAQVDLKEEEYLFEYLNLLVTRRDIAQEFGGRARAWAERECNWERVAAKYAEFLGAIAAGRTWKETKDAPEPVRRPQHSIPAEDVAVWAEDDPARSYIETHRTRLERTLAITPSGGPDDRVLEMGAYMQITPALKNKLGYGEVRGCYIGTPGKVEHRQATSEQGETFLCDVDLFDAEKDSFPYDDGYFSTVLCCELIEHLASDPMHMMWEIHRILKPCGHLVLTTPNIASLRAVAGILQGFHPMLFPSYIRPKADGEVEARHSREYTPREVKDLLENSGFDVVTLETGPFRDEPKPELAWVEQLLGRYILDREHRGDGIYAVGRKQGRVKERYPSWLYA